MMDSSSLLLELRSKVSLFDSVPSSQLPCRPAYGEASYWEDRYADEDASSTAQGKFEWLLTWADLAPVLAPELRGRRRLLHPGCGCSTLGSELRAAEVLAAGENGLVLNTDISSSVIEQMTRRNPRCTYAVDDCLDMKVARNCVQKTGLAFDVVLDKGTLDAFTCVNGTDVEKRAAVGRYLAECRAVLGEEETGRLIVVSFGHPVTRRKYFNDHEWREVSVQSVAREKAKQVAADGSERIITDTYYVYVMEPRRNG